MGFLALELKISPARSNSVEQDRSAERCLTFTYRLIHRLHISSSCLPLVRSGGWTEVVSLEITASSVSR